MRASTKSVEAARTAIENFNRRDFDAALAVCAEGLTWKPFLSQTETSLLRGRAQVKAAWESQVELLDLRVEPLEFIPVGDDKVVIPARLSTRGRSSGMSLTRSIAFLSVLGGDDLIESVVSFDSREKALEAAGLSE